MGILTGFGMIITCPACSKRYLLDGKSLGSHGRVVRCASCAHQWTQDQVSQEEVYEISSPPAPPPLASPGSFSPPPKTRWGWLLYVSVILGLLIFSFVGRAHLCVLFPKLYSYYQQLGIPVEPTGHGLKIKNLSTEVISQEGGKALIIRGEIWNSLDEVRPLPPLQVTHLTAGACEASSRLFQSSLKEGKPSCYSQRWTFALTQDRLMPGEKIWFQTPPQPAPPPGTEGYVHF